MSKEKITSLFISDLHLGCKKNKNYKALEILNKYSYENLFLLGDIIDIKALVHEWNWSEIDTKIWEYILKLPKLTNIVYTTGNHERGFFDNCSVRNIHFCSGHVYKGIFLTHGHQFDEGLESDTWPRSLINIAYNNVSEFNLKIASQLKKIIRRTPNYLGQFKKNAVETAKKFGHSAIMCGHTHQASIETIDDITYYNCGDFREDSTYIIEDLNGNLTLMIV